MGCVESNDGNDQSRKIDLQLKKYHRSLQTQIKMLLLGPGESGKSTIFKQMKIIQDNGGFSDEELKNFRPIVHANCVSQMKCLIAAASNLCIPFQSQENLNTAIKFGQLPQTVDWTPEIANMINILWNDSGVKKTFKCKGKMFQLNDTAAYFFDNVIRFASDDYVPSIRDALRTRVRSTGIEEAEFFMDNHIFRLVDVGGQRSERRKWIHCFESVTAVLFCASLSGYDEVLREDSKQNRMIEALLLFHEVLNSGWLKNPAVILFLNKSDLFEDKVKTVSIKTLFPEYKGGEHDVEKSKEFIKERFLEQRSGNRDIYAHFTCALDTENIEFVIRSTNAYVIKKVIDDIGLV